MLNRIVQIHANHVLGYLRFQFLIILAVMLSSHSYGVEKEINLKAAFVFKFCEYVSWPESSFRNDSSPIVIGVAEDSEGSLPIFRSISDNYKGSRPYSVQSVSVSDDLSRLHVLFLPSGLKGSLGDYIGNTLNLPVLTITDEIQSGKIGIINFQIVNNRIRFDISKVRAEKVKLKLSSQLLSVAHKVYLDD